MNSLDHTNAMSRMHPGRQSKPNAEIAAERKRRSSIPVSRSFADSSSYSRISSRSALTFSTRSSTPIDAPQNSEPRIQPVQHASDPLSDNMIPDTVRMRGEWKTNKFPVKNTADKRPSAVPSEPVVVKEEEARTDEVQAVSQTEIDKLEKKVQKLSYAVDGLVDQVKVREIKLQDTEKQLREVACANRVLQVGITQRTSEFANLSPENALWKQMSEKWQDQEIPDDDYVLKKDYIERHKRVNTMVIEDYVLMHVEIDQLGGEHQHVNEQLALERRTREQAEEQARELAAEGRAAQREIQILRDQVARERGAREQAEAEAREQVRELAAQQERITQLELENQRLTEQGRLHQEARNQAQDQAREQAAQLQAAQGQVAAVQGQNDILTQANDTLKTRVEELQNQQNETQQRNNALEAQRRDDVDLILAILDAQQLRENILAYHYNALLRQYAITRNDNEQLVQALVNTVNRYEDELAVVLCQMAEIAHIPGANDTNPRRSQPRSRPELRLVQNGSQRHSESLTPGGRWQQTIASRYAQRFPNSLAGLMVRALHFSNT